MHFWDVVRRRRMVRSFDPDIAVSDDVREQIVQAAVRAPTAGFSQGIEFLILTTDDEREQFWACTSSGEDTRWLRGMRTAPVLIVVLADPQRYRERYSAADKPRVDQDPGRWSAPFWTLDAGMASYAMLLAAVDAQLGACFFGVPTNRLSDLRHEFGVPDQIDPIGVIAIGHPASEGSGAAGSPSRRARRAYSEVVHMGAWRGHLDG